MGTWIVGGAGVALLASSAAAGVVAHSRYTDLKNNCRVDGVCDMVAVPDSQAWIDGGQSAQLASRVLLGVGIAALAAGVVLYFVEGRHHGQEPRAGRLAPAFGPGGPGFTFELAP